MASRDTIIDRHLPPGTAAKPRRRRRILLRTIGMSLAMILFTVAVFLVAVIPYQRQQLVTEMDQRAQVAYTAKSLANVARNDGNLSTLKYPTGSPP